VTPRPIGLAACAALLCATLLRAQAPESYSQNERSAKPATAGLPAQFDLGHRLFVTRCGTCHTLGRTMEKADLSSQEWGDIVDRMRSMASSHISDAQAKAILDYLIWDDQQRNKKPEAK